MKIKLSKTQWESMGKQAGWTSPDALQNTIASMIQNNKVASDQLANLTSSLETMSKGIPVDPKAYSNMFDQIISTLNSSKGFVAALIQYQQQSNQSQTPTQTQSAQPQSPKPTA